MYCFPLPFPYFYNSEPLPTQRKARKNRFSELASFRLSIILLDWVSCLWVKMAGWKTIWWKAMCLCMGLNFGPLTWTIIGPLYYYSYSEIYTEKLSKPQLLQTYKTECLNISQQVMFHNNKWIGKKKKKILIKEKK